ncbi:MAG TPA: hypothetical protein VHW02_10705 [Rhizomicrobium sp.]|nr:hypothetical protein [Rhizomicrobium sp.]
MTIVRLAPSETRSSSWMVLLRLCLGVTSTIIGAFFTTVALATGDPTANCPAIVSESDFGAAGGKLVVASQVDLVAFPHDFLRKCQGDIAIRGLIKTDGSVRLLGADHAVWCGSDGSDFHAVFQSGAWHTSVIFPRFLALRFRPPRVAGKPVCVAIERGWLSESPHRFWRSDDWKKYKGWK